MKCLQRLTVCSGKFPSNPHVPSEVQPVEPKILDKWKAPQYITVMPTKTEASSSGSTYSGGGVSGT